MIQYTKYSYPYMMVSSEGIQKLESGEMGYLAPALRALLRLPSGFVSHTAVIEIQKSIKNPMSESMSDSEYAHLVLDFLIQEDYVIPLDENMQKRILG